jgi:hypothetical protein
MPKPLDYRNPKTPDPGPAALNRPTTRPAIPIEFDTLLTRTQDHGAAKSVETHLMRQNVRSFRSEDTNHANRWIELYVRASDHAQASLIAARVFARRKKLNSFPRGVVDPPRVWGETNLDIGDITW